MNGQEMKDAGMSDILHIEGMFLDSHSLLICGIGGIGCTWARNSHKKCKDLSDLLLIDGDPTSLDESAEGHLLSLGDSNSVEGCAALTPLASQRMLANAPLASKVLADAELVVLLVGLGGGSGSGAAAEFARQAKRANCLIIAIVAIPFECQPLRRKIAKKGLEELRLETDVCVQISLDRLAIMSRERGLDWQKDSGWIEDLATGVIQTLAKVGLINLDLMDLRSIITRNGGATMFVAQGDPNYPDRLFSKTMHSPLEGVTMSGATGCLIQVEGGPDLTLGQVDLVADAFTKGLDDDAQVIFGARISEDLEGIVRVVAVLSGLPLV
jgi:cell division protein FtsZ